MAKRPKFDTQCFKAVPGSAIAELFNISQMAVSLWVSRDGCPRNEDGSYDLGSVIRWKVSRIGKDGEETGPASPELERFRKARADKAEIELLCIRNDLIPRDEVEKGRVERINVVKAALLALPRSLGPVLEGRERREIQLILKDRIEDICRTFSGQKGKK